MTRTLTITRHIPNVNGDFLSGNQWREIVGEARSKAIEVYGDGSFLESSQYFAERDKHGGITVDFKFQVVCRDNKDTK